MDRKTRKALRAFIVNRLREVTCQELTDFSFEQNLEPFEVAEEFDHEVNRIEKLFNFLTYGENE